MAPSAGNAAQSGSSNFSGGGAILNTPSCSSSRQQRSTISGSSAKVSARILADKHMALSQQKHRQQQLS
jgi:hypothetical protein